MALGASVARSSVTTVGRRPRQAWPPQLDPHHARMDSIPHTPCCSTSPRFLMKPHEPSLHGKGAPRLPYPLGGIGTPPLAGEGPGERSGRGLRTSAIAPPSQPPAGIVVSMANIAMPEERR